MTNTDFEHVCGYCRKPNGWHLWGCPKLDLSPLNNFRPLHVDVDEEHVLFKPFAKDLVVTLPEVE